MEKYQVKVNESIQIDLKEASTSGYTWYYEVSEDWIISMIELYDYPMKGITDSIPSHFGDSVIKTFKITGLKPGKVNIRFYQIRSWEQKTKPIEEKLFSIEVIE